MNLIKWSCIVVLLVSADLIAQKASTSTKPSRQVTTTQVTTQPSAIVAQVGQDKLTYGDLVFIKKNFMSRLDNDRILYMWKINTALAEQARQEGITKDPQMQSVLKMANNQIIAGMFIRQKVMSETVTEQEIKDFYQDHRDEFRQMPYVSARIIAAEEKDQIDKIKQELVKGGDFKQLCQKYREQTMKTTGLSNVEIKEVSAKLLVESLGTQVAYTMAGLKNFNQIIGPRRGPRGWILFEMTASKPGELIAYEKVSTKIKQQLQQLKKVKKRREIISKAEKTAGVKPPRPARRRKAGIPTTQKTGQRTTGSGNK